MGVFRFRDRGLGHLRILGWLAVYRVSWGLKARDCKVVVGPM